MKRYDLIVLGGGRAANLAIEAGRAGRRVALIERNKLGGTCPNTGCVPSKLLIGFAEASRRVQDAGRHFIDADWRSADWDRMFASTNEWIDGVDPRYESRMPDGVDLYRGPGRFAADHRIEVNGEALESDTLVIATGTRPRPAPYPNLPVWTNESIFPLHGAPPRSIVMVGGGFIGCELANFFAGIGVDTELLVRGDRLLQNEDEDIAEIFQEQFTKHVPTRFATKLSQLTFGNNRFELSLQESDGTIHKREAEAVLFAIGRIPNTDKLSLERTGIQTDRRGYIQTDEFLQTSVPGIYAAGDIAGRFIFQHAATADVQYLTRRLLHGEDCPIDYGPMPHAVYSDPEVAGVGATERELKNSGTPYVKVLRDWLASARAMALRLDYPRIKMLVSPEDYRILGCHLIGPDSATLIHEVLPVMRFRNDVRVLADTIHIHPALSEVILSAAVEARDAVAARQSPDLGSGA